MIEKTKRKTRRRGNGEGSIFRRSDGRWVGKVSVGYDSDGKRNRKVVYAASKKECQDELQKLLHRKTVGTLTNTSKVTVSQYMDRWLEDVARLKVRASTLKRYKDLLRIHVNPRVGGVKLHRLSAPDVQAVFAGMEEEGLSPRTRQFLHDVISMALDNAVRWGLVIRNVCDQLSRPRVQKQPMNALDACQAAALLKAAENDRLSAMYVLALTVGMRQGELFALHWCDVDLASAWLHIRHTLTGDGTLAPPKTPKSRRRIELPKVAVDALHEHRKAMVAEGQAASPFVFCDTKGGTLRSQNILRRSFRPILKAAELKTIRFHDMRHTAATLMLSSRIDAKTVSETLGHSSVAFTLDTYCHALPSMRRDAADSMDRLFRVAT